nr:MAG TPA: hypothetical protein [Caudoviricetes sp.]
MAEYSERIVRTVTPPHTVILSSDASLESFRPSLLT